LKCCCQCAILFEWSVNQTETLVFWEPVGSFNFCLENAWTWKGRWHHCFGGIPWIMVYWSGFLVPGGPIWCFLGFPGEYRVPVCEAVHFLGKTWLILGLGFWHIFFLMTGAASCYSWSFSREQVVSWWWVALPCANFLENLHV
jgi:hypothetical protein